MQSENGNLAEHGDCSYVSGLFFAGPLFSRTWLASFSGSFSVRFLGLSFIFNNFGSFVSGSFRFVFWPLSFVFNNFPGSFFKKRILFLFLPSKTVLQPHSSRILPPFCSLPMAS